MGRNPEVSTAIFLQSAHDEAVELWNEALDIINELLKGGDHEDSCSDIKNFRPCTKHIVKYNARCERARSFLEKHRPSSLTFDN
jgi:tRNA-dihydrouridine synthase